MRGRDAYREDLGASNQGALQPLSPHMRSKLVAIAAADTLTPSWRPQDEQEAVETNPICQTVSHAHWAGILIPEQVSCPRHQAGPRTLVE